jgi:hypothetical protein
LNSVTPVLDHFANLGIDITTHDGNLKATARCGFITDEIRDELKRHRECILSELSIITVPLSQLIENPPLVEFDPGQYPTVPPCPTVPVAVVTIGDIKNQGLNLWIEQVISATTLAELEQVLQQFAYRGGWEIENKAALSSAYTPLALRLIASEVKNKNQTLERLAGICWRPG